MILAEAEDMSRQSFEVLHCGQIMRFERTRSWRNGPLLQPRTTHDTSRLCVMCHTRLNTVLVVPD